jgi:carbonic anhydrase
MSCGSDTAGPVNIINTTQNCYNKCKLSYNFKSSALIVINQKDYLKIVPSNKNTTTAVYASSDSPGCDGGQGDFAVEEVRLYHPSVHTYGPKKTRAEGELIIYLNNISGGKNLIICIALTTKNGTQPKATSQLTNIINDTLQIGNTLGEGGGIQGLNFNLNDFIPIKKGFYSYTANLPHPPCTSCVDYIVYDMNDAAINLDDTTMNNFKSVITSNLSTIVPITDKINYGYNKAGALLGLSQDGNEIYIDCNPTGSSGDVLINESKNGIINDNPFALFKRILSDLGIKKPTTSITFLVIFSITLLGAVIVVGFYNLATSIFNSINKGSPKADPTPGIEMRST